LCWIGIGLLPALNLVPMPKPILEHRLYVPMIGAAIAVAYGIYRLNIRNIQYKHKIILLAVLCTLLALIAYLRLPVWKNGTALFSDAVKKSPGDLHSNYLLARALYDAGKYPETINAIEKYLALAPGDLRAYRFLREAYYVTGQKPQVAALSKKMIEIDPRTPMRYIETGVIYEEMNLPDSALMFYSRALSLDSSNVELYIRMGINEAKLSQPNRAEQHYLRAIGLNPGYTDAYVQLSSLYLLLDKPTVAINLLERGLQFVKPSKNYLAILFNLYQLSGSNEKAQALKQHYQF
jgi:protein O-mannosyl-transferase